MIELVSNKLDKSFEKGPVRRSLFSNGAVCLTHSMAGMETAYVKLYFLVGSQNESKSEHGITHLIEHLAFKEAGENKLIRRLELGGAELNAYTTKEEVCFEMSCQRDKVDLFLDDFFELFFQFKMTVSEFELEKQVVMQELREEEDDHESIGHEWILSKQLSQNIGHPIGGTVDDLAKFTVKKVTDYYKKYFVPKKMILSVCGGNNLSFVHKKMHKAMIKYQLASTKSAPSRIKSGKAFSHLVNFNQILKRQTENVILYFAFPAFGQGSEYYFDLMILDEILCEGLSSRFFIELREKTGLIYGLGSSINSYQKQGNYVWIFNCSPKNIKRVKAGVLKIWNALLHGDINQTDVEWIKARLLANIKMSFDSADARCDYLAGMEMKNKSSYSLRQIADKIDRVSLKRLKYLARKLEDLKMSTLVIYPK